MTLRDFYKNPDKPAISFELFPPKTDAAMDNLRQILPELTRRMAQDAAARYSVRQLEIPMQARQKSSPDAKRRMRSER